MTTLVLNLKLQSMNIKCWLSEVLQIENKLAVSVMG